MTNRSEHDANVALQPKDTPNWQKPAPKRDHQNHKVATLPQWLMKYLWRM